MKIFKFKKSAKESVSYGYRELKSVYHKNVVKGFVIAVIVHIILILIQIYSPDEKQREVAIRIITDIPAPPIKYIQRAPRLAKEIDVTKNPESAVQTFQPRDFKFEKATIQMSTPPQESQAKTPGRGGEGSVFYGALTGGEGVGGSGWGIPSGATSYGRSFGVGGSGGYGAGPGPDLGPQFSTDVDNTRGGVSGGGVLNRLKDDLIDYSNFTDRFDGLVQQDPRNKKKIQGFLKLYQLQYRGNKSEDNGEPGWNVCPLALRTLAEYSNSITDVKIQLMGPIRLDSRDLFTVPFIYIMGGKSIPIMSKEEIKNLGKYIRSGGFVFVDDGYASERASFNRQMRSILTEALGYDAIFERIPPTHPVYHSWEDFGGPPPGEDDIRPKKNEVNERYKYIEGIFIGGRLAVLFSSKGYCMAWGEWRYNPASNGGPQDNTRQLQFGINIMVYALTQKGGIVDQTKQRLASESQGK